MTAPALADTLAVPGATLYLEVRGEGPLVVLFGTPMDAQSFAPLAELLAADHTVLTTDPRGIGRSPVAGRDPDETPVRSGDASRLAAGRRAPRGRTQFHPDAVDTVMPTSRP